MRRHLASDECPLAARSGWGCERASRVRARFSPGAWKYRLIAIGLLVASPLIGSGLFDPASSMPGRTTLVGHIGMVEAVAFAPDGRILASAGFDHTIRLWETAGWEDRRGDGTAAPTPLPPEVEVVPDPSVVYAMAYAPDGTRLATATDRSLTIWSRDPSCRPEVEIPDGAHHALAFSPDGRTLAVGDEDGTVRLREIPSARERAVLAGPAATIESLAFSPDGRLLASGDRDGRVVLRDVLGQAAGRVLTDREIGPVRAVAFSPDGKTLGVAGASYAMGGAFLFDVATGAMRTRLLGHPGGVNALAFSPDGRLAATAGVDRSVRLWDLAGATALAVVATDHAARSLAFSPDGRWLACAGIDEDVRLLDVAAIRAEPPDARP